MTLSFDLIAHFWLFLTPGVSGQLSSSLARFGNVQSSKTFKECFKFGSPIHDTKRVMFLTCTLSFICCLVYPMMHFEENIVRGVLYPALVGNLV